MLTTKPELLANVVLYKGQKGQSDVEERDGDFFITGIPVVKIGRVLNNRNKLVGLWRFTTLPNSK